MKLARIIFVIISTFCCASPLFAQYSGGDNDGASSNVGCIQSLNGTNALIAGTITGSTQFCAFATEVYSISPTGTTSSTIYTWSVPAGASIISGQGTVTVLVSFGNTDGNVSVDVSNECVTVSSSLPVTQSACNFYTGSDNDGFASNIGCIQQLNGGPALTPGVITGSTEFCPFATEAYSIIVAGATPSAVYTWSVPAGATITSGQGTSAIVITFGASNGTISVDISNECETVNQTLAVTAGSCAFFAGGDNDGFTSNVGCIQTLNGTSSLIPGAIVGSIEFCPFATEAYTISVAGSTPSTVYTWSVPVGATITSGQGTNSIVVTFGGSNGIISVDVSNECATANQTLAVTAGSCAFFAGGNNDGFASNDGCIQSLNGGSGLVPGPIIGSSSFCAFATESYSIVVAGATSSTTYTWSVPVGATVTSGQGTNSILVTFGNTNGNVSVIVSNTCTTVNPSLAVTSSSCLFYAGGSNDGFSVTTSAPGIPLPIELLSFTARVESNKVVLDWITASELNNDFFNVQRSRDGLLFENIAQVDGAGTTNQKQYYSLTDELPFEGRSYYRLLQVDFDGSYSFSGVVSALVTEGNENDKVWIYPNPVRLTDEIRLRYYSEKPENVLIEYVDPIGRFLRAEEISLKIGWNDIPLSNLFQTSGIYVVHLRSAARQYAFRLIVLE